MSVDTANFSCLSDKVSAQPQVVKKGLLPDTMESPMAQTDAPVGAVLGDVLWARVRSVAGLQLDCAGVARHAHDAVLAAAARVTQP